MIKTAMKLFRALSPEEQTVYLSRLRKLAKLPRQEGGRKA